MPKFESLSKRELEIVKLAAQGKLDKEIVSELGVSINTLRTYWNRIRMKMGGHSRSGFAAAWVSESLHQQSEIKIAGSIGFHLRWEMDCLTETTLAPDIINDLLNLKRGVPHPSELYYGCIHEADRAGVKAALETARNTGQGHFSVLHRRVDGSGFNCYHSFGDIIRDGLGVAIRIEGHCVQIEYVLGGFATDVRLSAESSSDANL